MTQPNRTVILYGIAAVVLVFAFFEWVIDPIHVYQEELNARIQHATQQIQEIQRLGQAYSASKALQSPPSNQKHTAQFTLFSFLEQTADKTNVRKYISSMRQSSRSLSEEGNEESVEIRLEKMPLRQLVSFLYQVENTPQGVFVKTLTLRPNSTEGMNGELTVSVPKNKQEE